MTAKSAAAAKPPPRGRSAPTSSHASRGSHEHDTGARRCHPAASTGGRRHRDARGWPRGIPARVVRGLQNPLAFSGPDTLRRLPRNLRRYNSFETHAQPWTARKDPCSMTMTVNVTPAWLACPKPNNACSHPSSSPWARSKQLSSSISNSWHCSSSSHPASSWAGAGSKGRRQRTRRAQRHRDRTSRAQRSKVRHDFDRRLAQRLNYDSHVFHQLN